MQYGLAFNYALNRTGGFVNILLVTVCSFIPIVGPIVFLGYRSEVAAALLEDEDLRRHPKFDFDNFVDYLSRGIWPFLMSLVAGVLIVPAFIAAFVLAVVGAAAVGGNAAPIFILGGYLVGIGLAIALSMLAAPMQFHAELAGKFDLGAAFRFTKSFWLTVGAQVILSWLIFIPLSIAVMVVGMLACFVGVYPAASLIQMANTHVMVQLYDEYLNRGGEAIPLFELPDEDEEIDRRSRRRRRREVEDEDDDRE